MDTSANLVLFLDRVINGAEGRPDTETNSAILEDILANQLCSVFDSRAPSRSVEAASVPSLRLFGFATADGLMRRAAERAFHGAEAPASAGRLIDRCRRDDLDTAFGAVFAAKDEPL
jgi:hypothetical protein